MIKLSYVYGIYVPINVLSPIMFKGGLVNSVFPN